MGPFMATSRRHNRHLELRAVLDNPILWLLAVAVGGIYWLVFILVLGASGCAARSTSTAPNVPAWQSQGAADSCDGIGWTSEGDYCYDGRPGSLGVGHRVDGPCCTKLREGINAARGGAL